jgi:carbon storage regulator CsrA
MLVLTRKSGESIVIDGISIVVKVASGGRVILAIDAPSSVPIRRSEVAPTFRAITSPGGRKIA